MKSGSSMKLSQGEALEEVMSHILCQAKLLIGSYRNDTIIELQDLVNSGVLGVLEAHKRFDPEEHKVEFRTFVSLRIRGAMIDYIRLNCPLNRRSSDKLKKIEIVISHLEKENNGNKVSESDIAKDLGITLKKYREDLQKIYERYIISFEDIVVDDSENDNLLVSDLLSSNMFKDPEEEVILNSDFNEMKSKLLLLEPRSRKILEYYYFYDVSMKEIAEIFNLNPSRISQLHKEAISFLNEALKTG